MGVSIGGSGGGAEDDEIGLTNDVTVGGRLGKVEDGGRGAGKDHEIFVQSSFVQSENEP